MLDLPLPLITSRLVLRRFTEADLPAFYAYQRLPETARYLLNEPRSYAECSTRLSALAQAPFTEPGHWASFAIERVESPGVIGNIALKWCDGGREEDVAGRQERVGELGWTLAPAAQGHGYATEAARAVRDLATGCLGFRRLEAHLDARNTASAAVCQRLGMRQEALLVDNLFLKGEWTSEAIYALVAAPASTPASGPAGNGVVAPSAVARNA